MQIEHPYLMFLGDAADQLAAKTAQGIVHWRRDWCLGQLRLENCNADLGLPDMTIDAAAAAGVRTLVIGVANRGGVMSESWISTILRAIEAGMDVASGLHAKIADLPEIAAAASSNGAQLFDVRHPTQTFDVGTGVRRSGKRLLAVGTDCSLGKMYTALAVDAEMRQRGADCDFRATGQTGIFIAGSGVSVDAVVSDFISGATEWLAPANDVNHWDLVEGQGSLFHPSYAGVTKLVITFLWPAFSKSISALSPSMVTMRPYFCWRIAGMTARIMRTVAKNFSWKASSQTLSGMSQKTPP